jgi:hypothetical protein
MEIVRANFLDVASLHQKRPASAGTLVPLSGDWSQDLVSPWEFYYPLAFPQHFRCFDCFPSPGHVTLVVHAHGSV